MRIFAFSLVFAALATGAVQMRAGVSSSKVAPQTASSSKFVTTSSDKKTSKPKTKTAKKDKKMPPVLNFTMNSLQGKPIALSQYSGKVILIVNTASKCGFTSQYDGLQKLYAKYQTQGLVVLGFPANDFGEQEPGTDTEIGEFCRKNYGVTFPMFSKIAVTGASKAPLYKFLTESETNPQFAGEVGWNFEKFLVSRDGKIVNRFRSGVAPDASEMANAVEAELKPAMTKK